ncbi:hypothetical protein FG386_003648 [Cryptosporidium ryanae]|uniref:uncharacterized protein n=1 Tax=Cryptosporidium ryanae TaxID=515981 RepID=UPI00351A99A0|nr:hypothetical protein FG386_003648 [Cryptosporidium ryanae]
MVSNIANKIKPLFDRVLVQRIKPDMITRSGIFLPENIYRSSSVIKAKVISIGNGKFNRFTGENVKLSVRPGDIVLAPKYGGINVQSISKTVGDEEDSSDLIMYKEDELLGIVEGSNNS